MNQTAIVIKDGKLTQMNRATRRARRYDGEGGRRSKHIIYYPLTAEQINEFQNPAKTSPE